MKGPCQLRSISLSNDARLGLALFSACSGDGMTSGNVDSGRAGRHGRWTLYDVGGFSCIVQYLAMAPWCSGSFTGMVSFLSDRNLFQCFRARAMSVQEGSK